ncbi:hypothetical protein ACXHXG_12090 [Rhizobium sp. LEGMi198b]
METKTSSLTIAEWAKEPEDVFAGASIVMTATANLHQLQTKVELSTKELLVTAVVFIKTVMRDKRRMNEFDILARARGITPPKNFDPSKAVNGKVNPMLFVSRALIGEIVDGKWMPSAYAAKNFPNALRWLMANATEELDFDGIMSVLENAKTKVGRDKTIKGVEAAKAMDRAEHGAKRNSTKTYTVSVPREVDRLKPIATFNADEALFPVDDNGYGVCTIRKLDDGKFGIYFGSAENAEVAGIIYDGFKEHETDLQFTSPVTKSLTKSNFRPQAAASAAV